MEFINNGCNNINKTIETHMGIIINEVINIVGSKNLVSIVLLGGFGRGEGSVLIENGRVVPLNDYDILLVTNNLIPPYKLSVKISKIVNEKIGVHVDIFMKSYRSLPKLPPLIINYETKYGSKVIWGEDILKKMPEYKATDIPLWDGIFLLFNRMHALIYGCPIANDNKRFVTEQSIKGLHAACESLLLLSGDYHYSYEMRNKRFQEIFPKKYPQLYEEMPELPEYVDKAIKFKLKPDYSGFTNPNDLWNHVVDMYFKVFGYYLKTYYRVNSEDMTKTMEKFVDIQKEPYSKTIALWLYYIYQMYNHGFKVLKLDLKRPPNNFIYAAEPFLLRVLRDYPNYSQLDLKIAREYLNKVIYVKHDENIFAVRGKCILAWGRGEYE